MLIQQELDDREKIDGQNDKKNNGDKIPHIRPTNVCE